MKRPVVVTISGFDSSGGSGILADTMAIRANGARPCAVITAITAQNSQSVSRVEAVSTEMIRDQLDTIDAEMNIAAIKTGLISNIEMVEVVCDAIDRLPDQVDVVVDPVLASSSGTRFVDEATVGVMCRELFSRASLVTPNVPELQQLAGIEVTTQESAIAGALRMLDLGCQSVLVKGGHLQESVGTDVWVHEDGYEVFSTDAPVEGSARGTGCMLASTIASHLAHGACLPVAIRRTRQFVQAVLRNTEHSDSGGSYTAIGISENSYS